MVLANLRQLIDVSETGLDLAVLIAADHDMGVNHLVLLQVSNTWNSRLISGEKPPIQEDGALLKMKDLLRKTP